MPRKTRRNSGYVRRFKRAILGQLQSHDDRVRNDKIRSENIDLRYARARTIQKAEKSQDRSERRYRILHPIRTRRERIAHEQELEDYENLRSAQAAQSARTKALREGASNESAEAIYKERLQQAKLNAAMLKQQGKYNNMLLKQRLQEQKIRYQMEKRRTAEANAVARSYRSRRRAGGASLRTASGCIAVFLGCMIMFFLGGTVFYSLTDTCAELFPLSASWQDKWDGMMQIFPVAENLMLLIMIFLIVVPLFWIFVGIRTKNWRI